jgi:hypothetical protein
VYSDAAEAIAARRWGRTPDPMALRFPDALDGLKGVEFVDAAVRSSSNNGAWTSLAGSIVAAQQVVGVST